MKKVISLFLSVWLCCSLLFCTSAHAEETNRNTFIDMDHTYDDVILDAFKNGVVWLSDSKYGLRSSTAAQTLKYLRLVDPEVIGIRDFVTHSKSNGYTFYITGYSVEYTEDLAEQREAFDKRLPEVMKEVNALIPDGASEVEKIHIVHDYLISTTGYDSANVNNIRYETGEDGFSHAWYETFDYDAYGPFVKHYGVCQGLSLAFQYIMNQLGIRGAIAISNEANHGWNLVYLQETGSWYHVDLTADDTQWDVLGHVGHEYLLLSTDTLLQKAPSRSDFVVVSKEHDLVFTDSMCSDKQFESSQGWSGCFTSCHYIGHDLYTLDKLNQVCKNGTPVFTVCATSQWAGIPYSKPMGKLAPDGNSVYTITDDAIWHIDLTDLTYEKTTVEVTRDAALYEKVFGLAMIEGTLYYTKHQAPDMDQNETWIKFTVPGSVGAIGTVSWELEQDGTVSFSGTLPSGSTLYAAGYDEHNKMVSLLTVTDLTQTVSTEDASALRLFLAGSTYSPLSGHAEIRIA